MATCSINAINILSKVTFTFVEQNFAGQMHSSQNESTQSGISHEAQYFPIRIFHCIQFC